MNIRILLFALAAVVMFTACEKMEPWDKDKKHNKGWDNFYYPEKFDECTTFDLSVFEDSRKYEKYIVKEIIQSEACNCITEGFIKYVSKDKGKWKGKGHTTLLIDYGKGDCDGWMVVKKETGGRCHDKNESFCKVELDCGIATEME